ncbi:DUF6975 family protein [Sphingomonas sp.]|jgi:hypothetical protein|uniref:DUF6975 family protein n=1 Tax=Sphingomonas sp. TaxID=28214 RepID=UPI002ED97C6E
MRSDSVEQRLARGDTAAGQVVSRVAGIEGSTGNRHLARLLRPTVPLRDLGDLVHALCAVHGKRPDMIEDAMATSVDPIEREWLGRAAGGFADERHYLARLVSAAGPLPSTPGQAECESAFVGLRHAFGMLARSGRSGCAMGAIEALVMEWHVVRPLLDRSADRFHVAGAACTMPDSFADIVATPSMERAMAFGAQQLLVQHRGLWDLLESRAAARDASA